MLVVHAVIQECMMTLTKSSYALVIIMSNRKDWRPIGSMGMNKQAHNRTREIYCIPTAIGCINASLFLKAFLGSSL